MKSNGQTSFFYTQKGRGTAVVFLHGFLEDHTIWQSFTEELIFNYRVITPDLAGHGKTPCFSQIHTMETMAEGVFEILNNEQIADCILVGHSMGGYVSLAFAEKYPDKVKGIVLMNSTAAADLPEKQEAREKAIEAATANKADFVRNAVFNLFCIENQSLMIDQINQITQRALEIPLCGIVAASGGMKIRKDRTDSLKRLEVPKLYICGAQDPLIPTDSIARQAQSLGADCRLVAGGHMSYLESPSETLAILKTFLDAI